MDNDKLLKIKLVICDVDGVLTDGGIVYSDSGEESKCFNVKDGLGIRLVLKAGIRVGIITGRRSQALRHRCDNLGIDDLFEGFHDKTVALRQLLAQHNLQAEQVAFIGDDLLDLSIMKQVGVAVAVADAHPLVAQQADWVTCAKGGYGAVREFCEALLKAQDRWQQMLDSLT